MAWVDLEDALFISGKPGKGSIFKQFRDNMAALYEGSVGAPKIQGAAFDDGIITSSKFAYYTAGSSVIALGANIDNGVTTSMVKVKEIYVPFGGVVTTRFGLYRYASAYSIVYGQIYINGVAAGTIRSTDAAQVSYFTENITVSAGDLVQVYTRTSTINDGAKSYVNLLSIAVGDSIYPYVTNP